ncbi:MAG: glucosaminidase domain-containing protein [Campylobacterota bacterium]|nr:glucosaminidase domain-containing protein [Campylobacterota bacterium]
MVPQITQTYNSLQYQYLRLKSDMAYGKSTQLIALLKKKYRVSTDEELLKAIKPHPISIAVAQAAIESGWGTSRFFKEANNAFGMWAGSSKLPKIAASQKRNGKSIWVRKYATIKDSISSYYLTISRAKAYKKFKEKQMKTNNVYLLVKELNKYSELGAKYTKIVADTIRYNNLTKYDK